MNPSYGITLQPRNSVIWNMMLCASGHLSFPSSFFPSGLSTEPYMHLSCHMHRPSRFSGFDRPNNIWWGTQRTKLIKIQSLWVTYNVVPLRPKYLPQCPILKGLRLSFSFNAWGPVLHHNKKKTGKIIDMYILMEDKNYGLNGTRFYLSSVCS